MSCFIMKPENIYCIARVIAQELVPPTYISICRLPENFACEANLRDCRDTACFYSPEKIAEKMYEVNVLAYSSVYKISGDFVSPDFSALSPMPKPIPAYENFESLAHPFHYQLFKLVQCWLYQTAEGKTHDHPLRKAIAKWCDLLASSIVEAAPEYIAAPWG